MGNSCAHATEAVTHLATESEIQEAVRSIEEWQKVQSTAVRNGGPGQNGHAPLLQRVGGLDVVKKVVELFYRKLYGDPRLIMFLHDQDVLHLRAKQSAFITWLFGPPNLPYLGRSVRIAHLRIIKQRGFNGDDFDLGMKYFEQAMAELGAPEAIIGEVMRRLRPFKDAFFTSSPKDADEEARWVEEEREKMEAARQQQRQEQEEEEKHEKELRLQELITQAHQAAEADAGEGQEAAAEAAVGDEEVLLAGATSKGGDPTARPPSRSAQCPFTGGRLSRGASGCRSTGTSTSGAGTAVAPRPQTPPPPAQGLTAGGLPQPVPPYVAVDVAASGATRPSEVPLAATAPSRPASQIAARSRSSQDRPPSSSGCVKAMGGCVPSPTALSPSTPPVVINRPQSSIPTGCFAEASPAEMASAVVVASAPPSSIGAVPHGGFEAELDEIERAYYSPDNGRCAEMEEPLLRQSLEPSSSETRRTAVAC